MIIPCDYGTRNAANAWSCSKDMPVLSKGVGAGRWPHPLGRGITPCGCGTRKAATAWPCSKDIPIRSRGAFGTGRRSNPFMVGGCNLAAVGRAARPMFGDGIGESGSLTHPEWLYARKKSRNPSSVCGDWFADSSSRSAFLLHKRIPSILAAWNTESDSSSRCLQADGTVVVTQANGQVCILKLYHSNRRVSLDKVEEICFAKKDGKMKTTERLTFVRTETFRVATYNVENYLDDTASRCCVKSAASKAKVRECIRALRPDVLALQEIGSVAALMELRAALKAEGLDFPHWEHVTGSDANVHVAILSRFPFSARRPHTDDSFELGGQRFRVRRGFAEVEEILASHDKTAKLFSSSCSVFFLSVPPKLPSFLPFPCSFRLDFSSCLRPPSGPFKGEDFQSDEARNPSAASVCTARIFLFLIAEIKGAKNYYLRVGVDRASAARQRSSAQRVAGAGGEGNRPSDTGKNAAEAAVVEGLHHPGGEFAPCRSPM